MIELTEEFKKLAKALTLPATASRFAGLVDRDKRLAKCEAEYEAHKNEQKRLQGEQLDIFGEVA